jgi:hypothetical protein
MGLNIMGNGAHLGRKILVGGRSEEDRSGTTVAGVKYEDPSIFVEVGATKSVAGSDIHCRIDPTTSEVGSAVYRRQAGK